MSTETDIYSTFASFPSPGHVKDVCKPGAGNKTCRYLTMGPSGARCEKASSLKGYLDNRVKEGTMRAQGDNCEGILRFINDNQGLLVGKKTYYEESHPSFQKNAEFQSITITEREVQLRTTNNGHLDIIKDYIQIDINKAGITFSARGLGAFLGTMQVSF